MLAESGPTRLGIEPAYIPLGCQPLDAKRLNEFTSALDARSFHYPQFDIRTALHAVAPLSGQSPYCIHACGVAFVDARRTHD